ncbi:hypothetical protein CP8484711_1930, partial [Chlamydia psittaci 84-8471/1]
MFIIMNRLIHIFSLNNYSGNDANSKTSLTASVLRVKNL